MIHTAVFDRFTAEFASSVALTQAAREPHVWISIFDTDETKRPTPIQRPRCYGILPISFDDIDREKPGCISDEQAREIADFVDNAVRAGIRGILVHCEAGIGRSAAVANAIEEFYNRFTIEPIYRIRSSTELPNQLVYSRVLEALESQSKGAEV